jgi:hypothetical protein
MKVYNHYSYDLIGEFDISPNANLSKANLSKANLKGANLSGANLEGANLSEANLSGAKLSEAKLEGANLSEANLKGANLWGAKLWEANLSGAKLSGAFLSEADLEGANLAKANLKGANLSGAYLKGANLSGAKLPKFQIPQGKSLIVFKKLRDNKIAKLRIPARAKRTASLVGNKCRAERAFVEEIYDMRNCNIKFSSGLSVHDCKFVYEVGKEVVPNSYDSDIRVECRNGIHFFMTEEEACEYLR